MDDFEAHLLTGEKYEFGGVRFDNCEGLGAVPDCFNLHYMGALVAMTPRTFLKLAPPLDPSGVGWHDKHLEKGGGIGLPFLEMMLDPEDKAPPIVRKHEGRHRMSAIARRHGEDTAFPVALFLREGAYRLRARGIEMRQMERACAGARREGSGEFVSGPLFRKALWSQFRYEPPIPTARPTFTR